jgi:two-component system, cell cycle response regulator
MSEEQGFGKRILIAEDDLISRRVLERFLAKWGFEVVLASNGSEAWQVLQKDDSPRLAVLDWMMPELEGVQVCQMVRKLNDRPYVYILLLSARSQKQDILEGLKAGADDYLTKPFDAEELQARLYVGKRIIELQDNLIAARETLRFQATHDGLTRLVNRREILEVLRREMARQRREKHSLGVALADLDHFKSINDTYGHAAGDAVLTEAARRMTASLRAYDAVGRYGGEEFLVIAPSSDELGTVALAERVRAAISSPPMSACTTLADVTMSLGVAASAGQNPADAEALLRAADAALYRAKERGRNRVELATPADLEAAMQPVGVEHAPREPQPR